MDRRRAAWGMVIFCVGAGLPFWAPPYVVVWILLAALWGAFGQMWNVLAGYAGMVCLGLQAFVGIGGFAAAVWMERQGGGLLMASLVGGGVSAAAAFVMWPFIGRLAGGYFAVATWLLAETLGIFFSNWAWVGYGQGLFMKPNPPVSMTELYFAAVGLAALVWMVVARIGASRWGRALAAIREDPLASDAVGIDTRRVRCVVFTVAAAVTGALSGIYHTFQVFIRPVDAFSMEWTVRLVFIVIVGGMGTATGPFVGAMLYMALSQFLVDLGALHMVVFGATAVAAMCFFPGGLAGMAGERGKRAG